MKRSFPLRIPSPFSFALAAGLMAGCASTSGAPAPDLHAIDYAEEVGVDLRAVSEGTGGMLVQDRIEGTGREAQRGDRIDVRYTAFFPDGRILDTNLLGDAEPLHFRLGQREVVRGWDEGIPGMREGGVRLLVLPPALAYGRQGLRGSVPPDQVLIFEIQLVEIR